jgi:Amino acid permease
MNISDTAVPQLIPFDKTIYMLRQTERFSGTSSRRRASKIPSRSGICTCAGTIPRDCFPGEILFPGCRFEGLYASFLDADFSDHDWDGDFCGPKFVRYDPRMEETVKKFEAEVRLSRELKLMDATLIGVRAMIGAGIFVLTGIAAGVAGPALVLAFALNGSVALFTAMSYAELGSCYHDAGGGYLWARKVCPERRNSSNFYWSNL